MDEFFPDQLIQFDGDGDIFWLNYEALPVNKSAFVPYANRSVIQFGEENAGISSNGSKSLNANKKMIQLLRRIQSANMESPEYDRERSQRHKINERTRREREKQNYLALHTMLPHGTKKDKNSIVKTSAKRIQELQCCMQELERKNYELELDLGKNVGGTKIGVNVDNPTSGVDSILQVLKCLKNWGSTTRSIQAKFSDQKLTAILHIETQLGAGEMEKAVQRTLQQVEQRHQEEG